MLRFLNHAPCLLNGIMIVHIALTIDGIHIRLRRDSCSLTAVQSVVQPRAARASFARGNLPRGVSSLQGWQGYRAGNEAQYV